MQTSNIEQFNLVVLQLLSHLYEVFPSPIDIDGPKAIDIGSEAVPENSTDEESWSIQTLTEDVVVWLGEEGFLRYDSDPNNRANIYLNVRLSLKGLVILGYVPTSLQHKKQKKALIQQAREAISAAATDARNEGIKHVVSEIFKLAIASSSAIVTSISI